MIVNTRPWVYLVNHAKKLCFEGLISAPLNWQEDAALIQVKFENRLEGLR